MAVSQTLTLPHLDQKTMPKVILALLVPAGLSVLPALLLQIGTGTVIGLFTELDKITIALWIAQGAAIVSTILVHHSKRDEIWKEIRTILHIWLVLLVFRAADHANYIPGVSLYAGAASVLFAKEVLLVLMNASDSGVNTPWLTKIINALKAKTGDISPATADERLAAAHKESQDRQGIVAPIVVEVVKSEKPKE